MNNRFDNIRIQIICFLVVLLANGCTPVSPVTIATIIQSVRLANNSLVIFQKLSEESGNSVKKAYENLGVYLNKENLSTDTIKLMEDTHGKLKQNADRLHQSLNASENNAKTLFDLLEERANQNQTVDLKDAMIEDIDKKKDEFDEKLETAKKVLEKMDASIQKYDDILGFVQVKGGLEGINKYKNEIDQVIVEGTQLNQDIQVAVSQAIIIIDSVQSPSQKYESAKPNNIILNR